MEKYKLVYWRTKAGLSQSKLARQAGLNQAVISRLERGVRVRVSPDSAKKITEALHLEMEQVIEFEKMMEGRGGEN